MNKVFEKIIEKLEKIRVKQTCNKEKCDTKELCRICVVDDAIEIVKQEAEQYNNAIIDGKYCFQTCACTEKCDKCSRLCNGDIDWYENIDNWAEEYNNGWIPCSVRIPTEQERWFGHDLTDAEPREFIVMVKGAYEPTTGYYHSGYGCWVKDLTSEYDDKNTGYGNEIVAWRFFPQPYQPKGE